jgi:putative nucleotidyltransferase with HDIG domain
MPSTSGTDSLQMAHATVPWATRLGTRGHRPRNQARSRQQVPAGVQPSSPTPLPVVRYLPLAMLTTVVVVVAPALLVAELAPRGGLIRAVLAIAAAMALSITLHSLAAALWKRRPQSRDIVFADLMLWGWMRRYWTERHVSQLQELVESAGTGGSSVSVQLLVDLSIRLETRDPYTYGHSQRVARHATRMARAMGVASAEVAKIRTAALVHDVGKLYTPREILNNPGRLTDAEFEAIKRHPADGADMLGGIADPAVAAMVRHHHERLDGRGYPDGLAGSDIPLGARIIAVADTFDAVTSSRAYRRAGTQKTALEVLSEGAGSQLDGAAVSAFLRTYSSRRSVVWGAFAIDAPWSLISGLHASSSSVGLTAGAASLLPALGVVGVLGLSPGSTRHGQVDQFRSPTTPSTTAAARTRPSQVPKATTPGTSPPRSRPVHEITPGSHGRVRSGGRAPSQPGTAGGGGVTSRPGPSAPPEPPHTASSPPATPPAGEPPSTTGTPVPPPPAPPGIEVPTIPIPSVPPVTLPSVTTPSIEVRVGAG